MKECRHAVGYNLALVGYLEHCHIFRQCPGEFVKFRFHFFAHLHDIPAFLHLHAEQQAFFPVVCDIAFRHRIFPCHTRHILQTDILTIRSGEHYHLLYVTQCIHGAADVYGRHIAGILNPPGNGCEPFCKQCRGERPVAQSIM